MSSHTAHRISAILATTMAAAIFASACAGSTPYGRSYLSDGAVESSIASNGAKNSRYDLFSQQTLLGRH